MTSSGKDNTRSRLLKILHGLEAQGKSFAGYGASHSVTTLIYDFGLVDKLQFSVDDNPRKRGLFSPGCHIPVCSPEAIYQQTPDYVLIIPWRFDEQIIGKHQAYLERGGHFIKLLPELEVV